LTCVTASGVETLCVGVTIVIASSALINVFAGATITGIAWVAAAVVTVLGIGTGGLFVTFVAKYTFVDVLTDLTVAKTTC
jgi:hypothetical protein